MHDVESVSQSWRYPGGEVGVRAQEQADELVARIRSSDDLVRLLMYIDASQSDERKRTTVDHVFIPYLPYARQDRRAHQGDPIAINVLARILASSGVRDFSTLDAHSKASRRAFADVGCVLSTLSPFRYFREYVARISNGREIWLVAPDEGAVERVNEVRAVGRGVITCRKVRDSETGKLSGFTFKEGPEKLSSHASLVIVDDICDGGGTFLGVAAVLSAKYGERVPLHLWTTHGIYSKGLDDLASVFDTIGSTDSVLHGLEHDSLFTINL